MESPRNRLIQKYQIRAILFAALFLCFVIFGIWGFFYKSKDVEKREESTVVEKVVSPSTAAIVPEKPAIKDNAILPVPYTVQAPFINWTVHEESCEEAAILMYHQYLLGDYRADLDQSEVDIELKKMKNWQVKNYGVEPDLSIEKLGKFANDYYGHKYRVIKNGTAENIKEEISSGRPVLAPVMTHSLLNPHYGRQNTYHILLIKGYDGKGIYTNDAGVKEGKNYFYTWDILFSAIDSQTPKMNQGRDLLILE